MRPERARDLLASERERIERSLADLGEPIGTDELASNDEPADQGSVLYERELEEGLIEGLRRELEALGRAEARLAAGTYGLSVETGEPIPDDRLEAFPSRGADGRGRAPLRGRASSQIRREFAGTAVRLNASEPLADASGRTYE